ncbi:MAG: thioredoxin family protein [Epsilonproteobacteria bacterium]|nr:thioredoxin family protein [Campylobacterota bacterium]
MKKLFLFMALAISAIATELHWYDDYDAALREAKKEHKLVYIFISSSQCGWCHKFEKTTLQDKGVQDRLKKDFITVHLVRDFDEIPKQFEVRPVPRHYFTDANGTIIYHALGYRKVDCFNSFMDNTFERIEKNKSKNKETK